jgi:hypothetical protein
MQRSRAEVVSAKWVPVLATIAALLGWAGCSHNPSGGGGTQQQPILVAFQSAPPTSLLLGAAPVPFTAVVTNDPANRGVDWNLTCSPAGNCGTLAPLHSDSGAPVMYTPPASISGGSETVNLVAFAASDHGSNIPASFALKSLNTALSGSYVFDVFASIPGSAPYHTAGVFVADGTGLITGGELTDFAPAPDPISGGSYQIGGDGRGTILLSTNSGFSVNFAFVLLTPSHGLVNETDDFFGGTGAGTFDLQTGTAAPSGSYAFAVSGQAANDPTFTLPPQPESFGGVFNVDSPGTISGTGSVADENLNGTVTLGATLSGTISQPDSFGAVTMSFAAGFSPLPIQLNGYVVDPVHIKLVEFPDPNTGLGDYIGGTAIGQGNAAGTFHDQTALQGAFVYGILGQRQSMTAGGEGPFWATAAWAGLVTADGAGHLTSGSADQDVGGSVVSDSLTGSYSVAASATGRVTLATTFGSGSPGPGFVLYLTGNGNPALVLETDVNGTGAGIVYPQAAGPPSFSGAYGLTFVAGDGTEASGQMIADNSASLAGQISVDAFGDAAAFSGAFTPGANGRFAGSLTLPNGAPAGAFYLVDPTQAFFIENDGVQVSLGYFAGQTSLGGAAGQRARASRFPAASKLPAASKFSAASSGRGRRTSR